MQIEMQDPPNAASKVVTYQYPDSLPKSPHFQLTVNGEPCCVAHTNAADFACFSFSGSVEIVVVADNVVKAAVARPVSRGIDVTVDGNTVRFCLDNPQNISLEMDGLPPLFIYANPLELDAPSPDDPAVRYFAGGQAYDAGEVRLSEGETLYIEGGAVVRGCVRAVSAKNVSIRGRGILDGSPYLEPGERRRSIIMEDCEEALVEDIVMIHPSAWMLVLGNCRNVHIRNLKQIGEVISSDGIDIVGCRDVRIEGCFLRNNDDCIVFKALDLSGRQIDAVLDWSRDTEGVLVENCVLINDRAGNAIEIGYETRAESIRDITFRNCDILSVHGHGAAFSIHNGDRATVENIRFEDILVEHHYDKLVDLRILTSRWNHDLEHGHVRNVHFKNIHVAQSPFNVGYSTSLIGGWDAGHTIENVTFEDFFLGDKKALGPDDLDLYIKHASNIKFL